MSEESKIPAKIGFWTFLLSIWHSLDIFAFFIILILIPSCITFVGLEYQKHTRDQNVLECLDKNKTVEECEKLFPDPTPKPREPGC